MDSFYSSLQIACQSEESTAVTNNIDKRVQVSQRAQHHELTAWIAVIMIINYTCVLPAMACENICVVKSGLYA